MKKHNTLRLGIIGLGQAGAMIIDEIKHARDLPWTIAAAADPREISLKQFKAEFGVPVYRDAEELCAHADVDVVYIATQPWDHLAHCKAAARHGKHIIVEKPMALNLADCAEIVRIAREAGVRLLAGHTHSFDAPIRKMRELVVSGRLGPLRAINGWNFNEFNHRPRTHRELVATRGPVLNQGPHHVDIVRQIGGGKVRSVRGTTIPDGLTGVEGGYVAYLEFEDRVPATLVYDGRSLFDTAELFWWVGEGGGDRDPASNQVRRRAFLELAGHPQAEREQLLESQKDAGRYGGKLAYTTRHDGSAHQPFFGLIVVSGEQATVRQSPDGLYLYDADGRHEVPVEHAYGGRVAELTEMHDALMADRAPFHDGAWGLATLEVCFAILESARTGKEIAMKHQVAIGDGQ